MSKAISLSAALLSLSLWCHGVLADSPHPLLPANVSINQEAGRGGHLVVNLRVENSEAIPFILDTGSPISILDKSLESKLGERLTTIDLRTFLGTQPS